MEKWLNEIKGYEQFKGYKILDNGILLSYWNKGAGNERKSYLMDLPIELSNPLDCKGYIRNKIGGRNNYSKKIRRHILVRKVCILTKNTYIHVGHNVGYHKYNKVT